MRKQYFKRSSVILDRNFEFTDSIFENLARGLYASRWPEVTEVHCYRFYLSIFKLHSNRTVRNRTLLPL